MNQKGTFLILSFLLLIQVVTACSCRFSIRELTYEEYFSYHQVFLIKILEKGEKNVDEEFNIRRHWVRFKLIKGYKGEIINDTIWSPISKCRRELKIGEEYIYYGINPEFHNIGYCSRTKSRWDITFGDFDQELNFIELMNSKSIDSDLIKFANGQIIGSGNFKDGKFDGEWVFYFPNGQLRMKGRFETGEKIGSWLEIEYSEEYHDQKDAEIIKGTGMYEDGKKVGEWFYLITTYESAENEGVPYKRKFK